MLRCPLFCSFSPRVLFSRWRSIQIVIGSGLSDKVKAFSFVLGTSLLWHCVCALCLIVEEGVY